MIANVFLDLLLHRRCVTCGMILDGSEECLCTVCAVRLPYACYSSTSDNALVRRFWNLSVVQKGGMLLEYQNQGFAHSLVHAMKYKGRPDLCEVLGRLLAVRLMAQDFFCDIDVLIPIPLSDRRRHHRGYNQAERIARGVSYVTGLPIRTDILLRRVDNPSQTSLHASLRMQNVSHIFAVRNPDCLEDKHILLLDDVVTTGATITSAIQEVSKHVSHLRASVACIGLTIPR